MSILTEKFLLRLILFDMLVGADGSGVEALPLTQRRSALEAFGEKAAIAGKLIVTPCTRDLAQATGANLTYQYVVRFLMTNPGADRFNPTFGLGIGQMVGEVSAVTKTQTLILRGLKTLNTIDQTQPITANVYMDDNTLTADIAYTDASTGQAISGTIPIG